MLKTLRINVLVLFGLLFVLNVFSGIVLYLNQLKHDNNLSRHAEYEMTRDEFKTFMEDVSDLELEYSAFNGWSTKPKQGQLFSVNSEGFRHTVNPSSVEADTTCWFFGGSVVWGYGNVDSTTIPSTYALSKGNISATNYGETGFTSKQSLITLIKYLGSKELPHQVISIDGVNDMYNFCTEHTPLYSHNREMFFKKEIENYEQKSFKSISGQTLLTLKDLFFGFTVKLVDRAKIKIWGIEKTVGNTLVCDNDKQLLEAIADQLIRNWEMMYSVCKSYNIEFLAVLQPNIITSKMKTDLVKSRVYVDLEKHYEAFYPMLQNKLAELNYSWVLDMTDVFDKHRDKIIFLDDCHLNATGNRIVIDRIIQYQNKYNT